MISLAGNAGKALPTLIQLWVTLIPVFTGEDAPHPACPPHSVGLVFLCVPLLSVEHWGDTDLCIFQSVDGKRRDQKKIKQNPSSRSSDSLLAAIIGFTTCRQLPEPASNALARPWQSRRTRCPGAGTKLSSARRKAWRQQHWQPGHRKAFWFELTHMVWHTV